MYIPKKELEKLVKEFNELDDENEKLCCALKKQKEISENLFNKNHEIIKTYIKMTSESKIIKTEIIKYKERNQILEELYGKSTPIWQVNIDIAWRINPITKEQETFKIPKNININKIENVILSDDLKWVSFRYDDEKYKNKEFKIRRSLGEQLKIITPLKNLKNKDEFDLENINDIKDIKDYLESRGINANDEYWKETIDALIWYRGNKFTTSDFIKDCKFRNRETARQYLNKFIKFGLITRVEKGVYEVLFNF